MSAAETPADPPAAGVAGRPVRSERAEFAPLRRWFWLAIFLGHAAVAGAWWWLMPGGFAPSEVRFWTNQVLPPVLTAGVAVGAWGLIVRRAAMAGPPACAVPLFWTGLVASAAVLYPTSARTFLTAGVAVVASFWGAWFWLSPTARRPGRREIVAGPVAAAAGLFLAWGMRAPDPSTTPLDAPLADFYFEPARGDSFDAIQRTPGVEIAPDDATVTVAAGPLSIEVAPLLQFVSRSPDRCWTLLAPYDAREGVPRRLAGRRWDRDRSLLRYLDDGVHVLGVERSGAQRCEIVAQSRFDRPVYSHLNTFCEVTIRGHADLYLSFSPCNDQLIGVPTTGAFIPLPARFAYLAADGRFHVVEARRDEKGPFRTLAEGDLARDGELTIGLHDGGRRRATLVFADWARQASTRPSPTAGWGVPQNAVEFRRLGATPGAPVRIWMSLAATSVGRGFDSVGHAAGVYRNRMRIEVADPPPEADSRGADPPAASRPSSTGASPQADHRSPVRVPSGPSPSRK